MLNPEQVGIPEEPEVGQETESLQDILQEICSRLERLEQTTPNTRPNALHATAADRRNVEPNPALNQPDQAITTPSVPGGVTSTTARSRQGRHNSNGLVNAEVGGATGGFESVWFPEANHKYENVRDKYKNVRLAEDLRVHDSRAGIRKEDQQQYNRLNKCARMVETALRVLLTLDPEHHHLDETSDRLGDLTVTLVALIRYLQDEYAVLMVGNTTNAETSRIFRAFRRNTSAFSSDVIQDLRNAAAIVAAGQVAPGQQQTPAGYNGRRFFNRGRGGFRPGFTQGRGSYRQQQSRNFDSYSQFSRQNMPTSRDHD